MKREYKHEEIDIPHLATVIIDTSPIGPVVEIILADDYEGELLHWLDRNPYPGRVLFRGMSHEGINSPDLARFIEELHHWDHNGDGIFDGDAVAQKIDEAFWEWDVDADEFHRTSSRSGWWHTLIMKLMPPQPVRHIIFSYGEMKPRFRRWHYFMAIPLLLTFVGLIQLQIHLLPWTRHTVISIFSMMIDEWGFFIAIGIYVAVSILGAMYVKRYGQKKNGRTSLSKHTIGFFNKAAVYEEQAFREGAENWTFWQRVRSCLIFGAAHLSNLFYPLATILPLALGGAMFMGVYLRTYKKTRFRRTAVLEASLIHRVYNKIALTAVLIALILVFGSAIFGWLTFVVTILGLRLLTLVTLRILVVNPVGALLRK